jgi:hypothetical protein
LPSSAYIASAAGGQSREQFTVTLDREHAIALGRLAKLAGADEETLARSLLERAIDDWDVDGAAMVELLNGIPDALQQAKLGRVQGRSGETIPLEDL